MVDATTLRPVVLGYPPAKRIRECGLPRLRSGFGPRMLRRTRIGVACWLLRIKSAHAGRLHAQVAREGPPQVRPCRQSSCRPSGPNASQRVRLPPSSSQLRRLLSLATGEQRRLTLRSRADPPRQGTLPGSRAAAILRLPGKAPCLCGPLSSNVRRRMKTVPRSLALIPAVQSSGSIRPLRLQVTPFGRRASAALSITRRSPRNNESDREASRRAPASKVALCARNASGYPSAGWKIDTERRRPRSSR
jgi:hypothetical protein